VLDRYYFDTLWKRVKKLSGGDRKIAMEFVGVEIDSVNLLNVLRARKLRLKLTEELTVPVEYRLKLSAITGLNRVEDIISAAGFYNKILKDKIKQYEETTSLYVFEKALRSVLVERSRAAFTGLPFHIGVLLGFLKLKEVEIQNLKGIALGIDNGAAEADIKDVLVV
jgi:V/A-type H+-transporting ATPase subunit C